MLNHAEFANTDILVQLTRIMESSLFRNSPVLCNFLQFIVKESLDGRGSLIKEYTIGTEVLGRKPSFDPQIDAIVRIHAGRLRRALGEFYATTGKDDRVKIIVPKGNYAPQFSSNENPKIIHDENVVTGVRSKKPILAVMPFRNISEDSSRDFICTGLGEFLSTELARFQELSVISSYSCRHVSLRTTDIREIHSQLGANYILTGSVMVNEKHLRLFVQLNMGDTGEQIWSNSFMRDNTGEDIFHVQEEIVNQITAAVGGYYGVIYRNVAEASKLKPAKGQATYDAIFLYYQFIKHLDRGTFDKACESLEYAVKQDPEYSLAWAALSETYCTGVGMEFERVNAQMEVATKYANRAIALDPLNQHAYQALAATAIMERNKSVAVEATERCIALNPRAVDYVTRMGGFLIYAGEFERGATIIKQCMVLNPFFPPWISWLALSLYHFHKNEFLEAIECAGKIDKPQIPWVHIVTGASLAHVGKLQEAKRAIEYLIILKPDVGLLGRSYIGWFILNDDLVDKMINGLEKVGLIIQNKLREPVPVNS